MEQPPVHVLLVTAPALDVAERLVGAVVEERLAACGNIVGGVTSIYRWEGEVQREAEVLIIFKTAAARADALARRIRELHPYDVPEILALPVERGLEPYVSWVVTSTSV
jgi:periplasmic divalent cation tolerance protein